jgi:predicted alternative tryptophan synthase beta-subunit
MALIAQEVAAEREIKIPRPVREVYKQWRPDFAAGKLVDVEYEQSELDAALAAVPAV